jgi:hypothetical protein
VLCAISDDGLSNKLALERPSFLSKTVMVDDARVYGHDLETKQQPSQ